MSFSLLLLVLILYLTLQVNPNIAQDLIKEEPIIEVDQRTVSCNGG